MPVAILGQEVAEPVELVLVLAIVVVVLGLGWAIQRFMLGD